MNTVKLGREIMPFLESERGEAISDSFDLVGAAVTWALVHQEVVRQMVREIEEKENE